MGWTVMERMEDSKRRPNMVFSDVISNSQYDSMRYLKSSSHRRCHTVLRF